MKVVKTELSNTALPVDTDGQPLRTGEASVHRVGDIFYIYFNDWGDCPGINRCSSPRGCASCSFRDGSAPRPFRKCSDPFGADHIVRAYITRDFRLWQRLVESVVLNRAPGVLLRPRVVFNAHSRLWVMWYENRQLESFLSSASGLSKRKRRLMWPPYYAVATSSSPAGPFNDVRPRVTMPGFGRHGDFSLFVDNDGAAYHVRTGLEVVRLDGSYTAPLELVASIKAPGVEAPIMFKRQLAYYVVAGSDCCACTGGASLLVWGATAIAGPWQLLGDIGTRIGAPDDRHNPHRYVTNAQGSAVFTVGDQLVWLGNQWNTGRRRSADLLYWAQLRFETGVGANGSDPVPRVRKLRHQPTARLRLNL